MWGLGAGTGTGSLCPHYGVGAGKRVPRVRTLQVKYSGWFPSLNSVYHSRFKPLSHKPYQPPWMNFSTKDVYVVNFRRTSILVWLGTEGL